MLPVYSPVKRLLLRAKCVRDVKFKAFKAGACTKFRCALCEHQR